MADLHSRCEGAEAEWWQALVVGFAIELIDFAQPLIERATRDGPESIWHTAMTALDGRVRWVAGVETWPAHEDLAQRALRREALDAAEAAVLDELLLFHRRRGATDISTENQPTVSGGTMATKTATRKPKPAKPVTETDEQLVLRALSYHGWQRWQQDGISDDDLTEQIRERLGMALVYGPRLYAVDHTVPAIWFDQQTTSGVPSLADDELMASVRRLFSLPQPRGNEASPVAAGPRPVEIIETIDVPLSKIVPSPYQTRDDIPAAWLQEIMESMKTHGQTTPALGRWVGDSFELIAGHTRWTSALRIDWDTLRCEVCDCDDATAARLVYIENADRRELTVIERARGLKLLADQYAAAGRTQAEAAADAGVAESTASNLLRLLALPAEWQARLASREMSIEQGRALAKWADRRAIMEAFAGRLESEGAASGSISQDAFEHAMNDAVCQQSRSMGTDCLFKPTKEQRAELDIHEVKLWFGNASSRAFNVVLWDRLQKEAKKKQREEQKADQAEAKTQKNKPEAVKREPYGFDRHRDRAWSWAYWGALRQCVTSRKLKLAERVLLARMGALAYDRVETEAWRTDPVSLLQMTPAEYQDHLCQLATEAIGEEPAYDRDDGAFGLDEYRALAESLNLDPTPFFVVSKLWLECCGDQDLTRLAKQLGIGLGANSRAERITALADASLWPQATIPEICRLPESKQKGKKR